MIIKLLKKYIYNHYIKMNENIFYYKQNLFVLFFKIQFDFVFFK